MIQQYWIPDEQVFFPATAPCTSKREGHIPLSVNIPNGTLKQSSHTCDLLLTDLPSQTRKAHVFPGLVHNSLISVGKLCDNRCDVTFKNEAVSVMTNGTCAMLGSHDPYSGLWRVDLKKSTPTIQASCNYAHDTINQKELIHYLRASLFSPVKSTCIEAIKNGNFTSWPGLTDRAVEKCFSKSSAIVKGHLNQKIMNARSTKIQDEI
jgi:hypothetical protein